MSSLSAQDGTLDSLSQFISGLVQVLDNPQQGSTRAAELGIDHGKLQARLNRSVDETLSQLYILQEATFEALKTEESINEIHRSLIRRWFADGALHVARSIAEFMEEQAREERELRERFVLAIAHDLRSPLAGIRTYAEIVSRYPNRADRNESIAGRIIAGVDRLDRMVSNIYDTHRIRGGLPIDLELRETDFASVLHSVIENLSVSHGDRFITQLSGNLVGHWCADALARVVENLLTNALKYGHPTAPIVITAGTPPQGTENDFEFSVSNEGDPIPLAEQSTLFQLFARANSPRRTGKTGWGIGLALVRALIEAHGGSVRIESAAGSGTTFYVRLPRDARLSKSEKL
jgi:signal transduction histidine kinase